MTNHLTALDATFLELEEVDDSAHMHIGGVLVFEPAPGRSGAPPIEEIRERLAARLGELPRFRHRLSEPRTGGLHWPSWVPDEYFDMERHVWQESLPEPAGEEELRDWAGRFFSERLTRSRPLWEIVSLELADGGWALASKTHHCMVDGVGSIDIVQTILDAEPEPQEAAGTARLGARASVHPHAAAGSERSLPMPVRGRHRAAPGSRSAPRAPDFGLARRAADTILHPRELGHVAQQAEAVTELLIKSELVAAPDTTLNEPIGPARRLALMDVALADLKEISHGLGGTVNDVVLAATGTAMRRLLIERGELLPERGIRAMVPVDIRSAAKRLELGNEITSLFVELPVDVPDTLRRYAAQVEQAESLKSGSQATGSRTLIDLAGHAPPILHAFLARALYSTRLFNLTITNVPGPQIPLYAFGSRLKSIWPLVPLAAEHALGLAVFSYDGRLFFCFNGDPESVPELDEIAESTQPGGRGAAAPGARSERRGLVEWGMLKPCRHSRRSRSARSCRSASAKSWARGTRRSRAASSAGASCSPAGRSGTSIRPPAAAGSPSCCIRCWPTHGAPASTPAGPWSRATRTSSPSPSASTTTCTASTGTAARSPRPSGRSTSARSPPRLPSWRRWSGPATSSSSTTRRPRAWSRPCARPER